MTDAPFSLVFIESLIERVLSGADWTELTGEDDGPFRPLVALDPAGESAGYMRVWRGPANLPVDRMIHMRLLAGPVETQLLFIFGRAATSMPHLHAQAVQFPPDGCVYNVDFLARLDPVDHPEWFTRVFSALRRPYRQATADRENTCDQAPANPALALFMTPWGIASGRTTEAELQRVMPSIEAYVDHYVALMQQTDWEAPAGVDLVQRDRRHLRLFFDDELDPRAWNGVYRIIGEDKGRAVKALFQAQLGDQ
jgi:hypothetical protein